MRFVPSFLLFMAFSLLGVGCCHLHSRGCYDPSTGLVRRGGLFDTCGTGCCPSTTCTNSCEHDECGCDNEKWYDFKKSDCDCKKSKSKSKSCKHKQHDCDCHDDDCCDSHHDDCCEYVSHDDCGCDGAHGYHSSVVNDGALIPYDGTYSDGQIIYEGTTGYEDCPTCRTSDPTPTYAPPSQPMNTNKPMNSHGSEPMPMPVPEDNSSIPPASYIVPEPLSRLAPRQLPMQVQHQQQEVSAF